MSDDKILRMERIFAATPQQVFDAWTKADQLVRWWGPEGASTPHHDLDGRAASGDEATFGRESSV